LLIERAKPVKNQMGVPDTLDSADLSADVVTGADLKIGLWILSLVWYVDDGAVGQNKAAGLFFGFGASQDLDLTLLLWG
jgi:hypothetical protein